MGLNINNIPNVVTVMPDGTLIYGGIPGGANPDPFEDAVITKVNFFLPLQVQITANDDAITILEDSVTVLQGGLTKTLDKAKTTSYTITQNADSSIISFGFRQITGTTTVAVGTGTVGDAIDDIVSSRVISDGERSQNILEYSLTSRTLYITITGGGWVDVVRFSRENLYEV